MKSRQLTELPFAFDKFPFDLAGSSTSTCPSNPPLVSLL